MDKQRETGVLLIAATLVAAIKLRGEPINNSPKVQGAIRGFNSIGENGAGAVGAGLKRPWDAS